MTKAEQEEKKEIRTEAYKRDTKRLFAKSMLKPRITLNKKQIYDWDEFQREYLADEQPYTAVREFFAKTKGFKKKTMESKHFKQKTNGWKAMKLEKLNVARQLVHAQSVQDGFKLINQQQVDYIKAKARFARNTVTVLDQLSFSIEQKNITGDQVLSRAKSLQALVKITDSIFKETEEYLKDVKHQQAQEEEATDIAWTVD